MKEEEDKRLENLGKTMAEKEKKKFDKNHKEEIEKINQKLIEELKRIQERGDANLRYKTKEIERLRKEGKTNDEKKALTEMERTKQIQTENRAWYRKFFDASIGNLIAFISKISETD